MASRTLVLIALCLILGANCHTATSLPLISCPASIIIDSCVNEGAYALFDVASTDDSGALDLSGDNVECFPSSGSVFRLGSTLVECKRIISRDLVHSVAASCSFYVQVIDNVAPLIVCPTKSTSSCPISQAFEAKAHDACHGSNVKTSCSPPFSHLENGSPIIGTCSAVDPDGNTASCSFSFNAVDSTPPIVTVPDDQVVHSTDSEGALVSFVSPTAFDDCSLRSFECVRESFVPGNHIYVNRTLAHFSSSQSVERFLVGKTSICCEACDDADQCTTNCFHVVVKPENNSL